MVKYKRCKKCGKKVHDRRKSLCDECDVFILHLSKGYKRKEKDKSQFPNWLK